MNRRDFTKSTLISCAGISSIPYISNTKSKLKIGIIGSGLRGQNHIYNLLNRDDVTIQALADPDKEMIKRSLSLFDDFNRKHPIVYGNGNYDYLNLLDNENLDAIIISTPWKWHVPMAIEAMERSVFVGLEVSGASSLDECWQLVQTYERTQTPLYFLENVCFRRDVLAILNMVRSNAFGELIHLECGYQHDLRGVKFNDGKTPYDSGIEFGDKGFSEAKWRTYHSIYRNGDLYPTHGIGPVSQFININRGNRLVSLTSMASKSKGLNQYVKNHKKGTANHPNNSIEFKLGDKITTMIQTANEETIVMHHDTNLPRPYSLGFRVQGTKGIWMDVNKSIHIEGISPAHQWEEQNKYLDQYDHKFWREEAQKSKGSGHGGMDYFMTQNFIQAIRNEIKIPFDVYDAATWMSLTPLSEASITKGSEVQYIPDFTNGKWFSRTNNFAIDEKFKN